MNRFMQIEKIVFGKNNFALCALPNDIEELEQTVGQMGLVDHPVIVLIGGHIMPEHAGVTLQAIDVIAKVAEVLDAAVICGGTDGGVMAAIGKARSRNSLQFPLIGIAPEGVVTWPEGPRSAAPLLPGSEREQLEPHHSHFILVPGNQFGDESKWIVRTATMITLDQNKSVTVLVNGGKVSQQDVEEGLAVGRPLLVLSGTGRLADEIAAIPVRNRLIKVISAHNRRLLAETLRSLLI
jgi:predicted Rossmann-fold nucleotide-binding protein